ncbi:YkvA family protein [Lysobacter sp. HA35]
MSMISRIRRWARALKQDTLVVYFAARDPRTPWAVRLFALGVAAYALSPIDLIPDFIPVLGYLDDLLIVPLGIALVMRWLPAEVKADAHARAAEMAARRTSRGMAIVIAVIWVVAIALVVLWGYGLWHARRA